MNRLSCRLGGRCGRPGAEPRAPGRPARPAAPRSSHLPVWAPKSLRSRKSGNITDAQEVVFWGATQSGARARRTVTKTTAQEIAHRHARSRTEPARAHKTSATVRRFKNSAPGNDDGRVGWRPGSGRAARFTCKSRRLASRGAAHFRSVFCEGKVHGASPRGPEARERRNGHTVSRTARGRAARAHGRDTSP